MKKMGELTKERGIAFHCDGARLWEAQPYYGVSFAELCADFDSVYVSYYKVKCGSRKGIFNTPIRNTSEIFTCLCGLQSRRLHRPKVDETCSPEECRVVLAGLPEP